VGLEQGERARASFQRNVAFQFSAREAVPGHDRKPRLIQPMNPRIQMSDRNLQGACFRGGPRNAALEIFFDHFEGTLEKPAQIGLDIVFPVAVELPLGAIGRAGKEARLRRRIVIGCAAGNLPQQIDRERIERTEGYMVCIHATKSHDQNESCTGNGLPVWV
jgi:hypothetical protein